MPLKQYVDRLSVGGKQTIHTIRGTRDFGPKEVAKDNIIDTIKRVYHLCGYQPRKLPVMETQRPAGKYGETMKAINWFTRFELWRLD